VRSFEPAAIADFLPLPEGEAQYGRQFIESRGAIVLRRSGRELWVGVASDAEDEVVETLAIVHREDLLHFRAVDRSELTAYLGRGPSLPPGGASSVSSLPAGAISGRASGGRVPIDRLACDAPVVNLVNSICIDGIRSGASDIHIEAFEDRVKVRYRIDGFLRTARTLDRGRFEAISSRIKVMADLNIMERRLPQDGRISVHLGDDSVDLRVSIVPIAGGESVVLRILDRSGRALALDQLGFDPGRLELVRRMLASGPGLVLVTGPTGSGKTTTLNAMLRELAGESLKIITIEDPVEYLVDGVSQIQTNDRIDLGFDAILRRVLRQDPNVVMVGEIRDPPTAELAARAAMTGHLVLSTLHTADSVSVLPRLRDLGVRDYVLASVLRGAVAQRLVRRICPACAREREPEEPEVRILGEYGYGPRKLAYGSGCEACGGTGFRGRIAVSEGYVADPELGELILGGSGAAAASAYLRGKGMASLAMDGVAKAARGLTTVSELARELEL